MKIFQVPFSIANEVVKRRSADNRRLADSPENGGNDFFYLGTPDLFIAKFDPPLQERILQTRADCDQKFANNEVSPRTLQPGEGIKTEHRVSKKSVKLLLQFIEPYLVENSGLYHNPNLNREDLETRLNEIDTEDITFDSDLVFIRDAIMSKPYFKWFNSYKTKENFKLVQELFIPGLSFLNFICEDFVNGILGIRWEISYAPVITQSSDDTLAIVDNALRTELVSEEERQTIREAIVKVRVGQSQFREDLLNSERNSCIFTGISSFNLLIASHIKPWADSSGIERTDIGNGLLLSPLFDKLFDKFLITFNEDGSVRWSDRRLESGAKDIITGAYPEATDVMIQIEEGNRQYFEYHRRIFEEKENA